MFVCPKIRWVHLHAGTLRMDLNLVEFCCITGMFLTLWRSSLQKEREALRAHTRDVKNLDNVFAQPRQARPVFITSYEIAMNDRAHFRFRFAPLPHSSICLNVLLVGVSWILFDLVGIRNCFSYEYFCSAAVSWSNVKCLFTTLS